MINISLIQQSLPALLHGATITLEIAFLSALLGITLGTILGLAQTSHSRLARAFVTGYVTIIRGTPMLIHIMFAYYALPQIGISLPALWVAVIAIGLNSAAYVSQIIRSGIKSVNRGTIEAARALGFSRMQIIRFIVLPQAFRVVIPSLGNEFITLVKDSSLASLIGVHELYKESSIIRSRTFDAMSMFVAIALIYLVITTSLSILINHVEKRMNRHVRN